MKFSLQKCASSNSGIFAFFAFITLNLNVMVDFMFSLMVDIMIMGTFNGNIFVYQTILLEFYTIH